MTEVTAARIVPSQDAHDMVACHGGITVQNLRAIIGVDSGPPVAQSSNRRRPWRN